MPHHNKLNVRNAKEENNKNEQIIIEKFDSYIKKIIKNEIIDYKRKKARLYSQELPF